MKTQFLNKAELKKYFTDDEIEFIENDARTDEQIQFVNDVLALPNATVHGTEFLWGYITDSLAWWHEIHPMLQNRLAEDFEEVWEADPRNE